MTKMSVLTNRFHTTTERVVLGALLTFTLIALAGFAIFVQSSWGIRLLGEFELLGRIFASSFTFFAQANIVIGVVGLVWYLTRHLGRVWIPAFVLAVVASFLAEYLGTTTGIPFSAYEYTPLLGPKLFGHLPFLIPLSWFVCCLPAYVLAAKAVGRDNRIGRVLLATFLVVLWDVSLDPAMSFVTSYWVWAKPGAYYGMPLVNLVGWAVTAFVTSSLIEWTSVANWVDRLSGRWMLAYYGILLLLPVGMLLAAGIWIPAVLTLVGLGLYATVARRSNPYILPRSIPFQYMSGSA